MADAVAPQTTPKKLFKPSSKTKTITPVKRKDPASTSSNTQPTQQTQSTEPPQRPSLDSIANSTVLQPLTNVSAAPDKLAEPAGSDTTTTGVVDNVATPTDTASRSTDAQSPLSRSTSQNKKNSSSSFMDKISGVKDVVKDPVQGLTDNVVNKPKEALDDATSSLPTGGEDPTDTPKSPATIARYFSEKGNPEMGNFIKSLMDSPSPKQSPQVEKSPDNDTQSSQKQINQRTSNQESNMQTPSEEVPTDINLPDEPKETNVTDDKGEKAQDTTPKQGPTGSHASPQPQPQDSTTPKVTEPADVSKMAEGTFRDTKDSSGTVTPTNNIGEPDVSKISQSAQPTIPSPDEGSKKAPSQQASKLQTPRQQTPIQEAPNNTQRDTKRKDEGDDDTQVAGNMGRPARVERSIEIPLERPEKPERPRVDSFAEGLGDYEDLPKTEDLRSLDELHDIPEHEERDDEPQDPPEEILDPDVHLASASITPIPKIPKIEPIDFKRPADLPRRAKGLAGYAVDDVGNIVDEEGKVLGHAVGDLPSMVGKKVSDNGEIYDDSGETVGHVSQNFINPPSPMEIPQEILGGLKVDQEGNILNSNGDIIGKFNQKPRSDGSFPPFMQSPTPSPKTEAREKPKEQLKPRTKENAQTGGGSPSDLFLDVKSTTDGIQLTIRIPTTFSRRAQE